MDDAAVLTPPAEAVAAPVAVETPQTVEEVGSIAEHQAAYGRVGAKEPAVPAVDGVETAAERAERDERGRFRHRAKSQQATAEDVAEISTLTRQLREKERELAKVEPDAVSGSPRVLGLKRQIEALDARLSKRQAPPVAAERPPAVEPPAARTATLRAKPTEEEIGTKYQTYGDFVEDLTDWKTEQRESARESAKQQEADSHAFDAVKSAHAARIDAFAKTRPDFASVTASILDRHLPPLLLASIVSSDKSAETMYYLAQHPGVLDELHLLTDNKDVTPDSVAIVQRRINDRVSAATTGSATATRATYTPPRPPNPVRTGPLKTDDAPPDGEHSLREHARHWGKAARR